MYLTLCSNSSVDGLCPWQLVAFPASLNQTKVSLMAVEEPSVLACNNGRCPNEMIVFPFTCEKCVFMYCLMCRIYYPFASNNVGNVPLSTMQRRSSIWNNLVRQIVYFLNLWLLSLLVKPGWYSYLRNWTSHYSCSFWPPQDSFLCQWLSYHGIQVSWKRKSGEFLSYNLYVYNIF